MSDLRPPVAISACLLGEPVRYDGGHKRQPLATRILGDVVRWIPICPEVELGLGVPREPLRLEQIADGVRLVGVQSRIDLSDRMDAWAEARLDALEAARPCGFVLKARSPSCGVDTAPLVTSGGAEVALVSGRFGEAVRRRWPARPVFDERVLADSLAVAALASAAMRCARSLGTLA